MMQGVVDFGTGVRLRGMGLKMNIAGKTGTTNGNTDTWFLGYTPQLLGGVWVGCDDPFLKMTGEGNRMALPIWGYFFDKAYNNQSLGLQKEATFIKPESMNVESNMDYENFTEKFKETDDAEQTDQGSGNADDFFGEDPMPENETALNNDEVQIIEEAKKERKPLQEQGKQAPKGTLPKEDNKNNFKRP
jgi:penicillin-binding protein 1A